LETAGFFSKDKKKEYVLVFIQKMKTKPSWGEFLIFSSEKEGSETEDDVLHCKFFVVVDCHRHSSFRYM